MEALGEYVIAIITGALICGVISALFPDGTEKTLIRILCGLFLTLTVLSPAASFDIREFTDFTAAYSDKAAHFSTDGVKMASESASAIIKQQTQAYILDKAAALNTDIAVDIVLDAENIPKEATIAGSLSPYAKKRLEEILTSDLGITKEHQRWTG